MENQQTPEGKEIQDAANDSAGGLTDCGTSFERTEHIDGFKSGVRWQKIKNQEANAKLVEALRDIATGRIDAIGIAKEALKRYTHD